MRLIILFLFFLPLLGYSQVTTDTISAKPEKLILQIVVPNLLEPYTGENPCPICEARNQLGTDGGYPIKCVSLVVPYKYEPFGKSELIITPLRLWFYLDLIVARD